jgi:tetratricopeptide (TPR) repeat protein
LEFDRALQHLELSLKTNVDNLNARNLRTTILRIREKCSEAVVCARETRRLDPLDIWSRYELSVLSSERADPDELQETTSTDRVSTQLQLDLAFDYAAAGFWVEARNLLSGYVSKLGQQPYPMLLYVLGDCADKLGDHSAATLHWADAAKVSPDYCFPARIEEMIVLQRVLSANPADARAHYYLGNLLYDKKRYDEAIGEWEASVKLETSFAIPWRNLGIAYFNVRKDPDKALIAYEKALKANTADARLLYELDQLRKRTGAPAPERLALLETHPDLVSQRDDLTVELITLLSQCGRPKDALQMLMSRRFHPWEGGEGLVAGQYVWAHILIGRCLLEGGDARQALEHFSAARVYPQNLGEGKHLLTRENHLDYFVGVALQQMGFENEAREHWTRAAADQGAITWLSYYRAMSLEALGRKTESTKLLTQMRDFADKQMATEVKIDYFATSLPNLLLFEDDLAKRNQVDCLFMLALGELGLRNKKHAVELLKRVLSLDSNHIAAQQELESLTRISPAVTVRQ